MSIDTVQTSGLKTKKPKYYRLKNILQKKATYNVMFGERSNGKTYAVQEYCIKQYLKTGGQTAWIRRWQDDFKGKRARTMWDGCVNNGELDKWTNGQFDHINYKGGAWYLAKFDETLNKDVEALTPFAYSFAISAMEHDKSTNYDNIINAVLDEFLTRTFYLPNEFVLFMNVLSTIIRDRDNVIIFMMGNTVNQYCPYFAEMGLTHIKEMKKGDIDVYEYGESGLTVAVEYTDSPSKEGKKSDKYFAFNNPKLSMITGGAWEIAIYPHCPCKYKPSEVLYTYFIIFDREMLQCEIIFTQDERNNDVLFTFIHRKTSELKDPDHELIYSPDYSPLPNRRRKITKPTDERERKICSFFSKEKVFYQDNTVGEIVRNYIMWCQKGE